jgi:signal transduction histidine kinase
MVTCRVSSVYIELIKSGHRLKSLHEQTVHAELRHEALINNLWVILATIIGSALISLPFADIGFTQLASGFSVYFVTNCLALWAAYSHRDKLALLGYTAQVFICTTTAMVLLNDQPAHMVLAMVNFVLLHAVVLGQRWALGLTTLMVLLLIAARWFGEMFVAQSRQLLESDGIVATLSDRTIFSSLLTTTLSTGYLITTTVSLQERSRLSMVEAHRQLKLAQEDLQHRHERVELLSEMGAASAIATSHKDLHLAVERALKLGLTNTQFELVPTTTLPTEITFGRGPTKLMLISPAPLTKEDMLFAGALATLFEGADTRMETDKRLHETERLEGVGRLAASVAHDFNNLLMPIQASFDLLKHHKIIQADNEKWVAPGLAATRQAMALVKKLLVHARSTDVKVERVDFRSILQSSEALLRTFAVGGIDLRIELPDEEVQVMADRIELEQVVLNLVLNALTAVESSGTVIIALKSDDCDATLEVRDDGPGIPTSLRSWVLEPFNSTRAEGSGLGLTTVDRIARSGGGSIEIGVAPEGGALLSFSLPVVIPAPVIKTEPTQSVIVTRSLNVLLVEDDPNVQDILREMLLALGHTCVLVSDGRRAVEMLQGQSEIELIITDYQMPGLNGAELVELIRARGDNRPVVLISGYGAAVSDKLSAKPTAILGKPLRLHQLEAVLAEVFPATS